MSLCRRLGEAGARAMEDLARDARLLARGDGSAGQGPREGAGLVRTLPLPGGGWVQVRVVPLESRPGTRVLAVLEVLRPGTERFQEAEARRFRLTRREREVACLAARGLGNRHIAHALGISEVTVRVLLGHVYRKTGTDGRVELARLLCGGEAGGAGPQGS